MNENFDRMCLLISNVFHLAHQDAHRGDPDALDFLALYGIQPKAQGHRVFAPYSRGPQRKTAQGMQETEVPDLTAARKTVQQ